MKINYSVPCGCGHLPVNHSARVIREEIVREECLRCKCVSYQPKGTRAAKEQVEKQRRDYAPTWKEARFKGKDGR